MIAETRLRRRADDDPIDLSSVHVLECLGPGPVVVGFGFQFRDEVCEMADGGISGNARLRSRRSRATPTCGRCRRAAPLRASITSAGT